MASQLPLFSPKIRARLAAARIARLAEQDLCKITPGKVNRPRDSAFIAVLDR